MDSTKPNIQCILPNKIYSVYYQTKYTVYTYQTKNKVNTTEPNIQCILKLTIGQFSCTDNRVTYIREKKT